MQAFYLTQALTVIQGTHS